MSIILLETFIFIIFMISYLTTALINPGIPDREYYSKIFISQNPDINPSGLVKCSKCNIVVPKHFRLSHCDICQVCVKKYDHHCPWTGKCIGEKNIIPFYVFICFLLAYMFMSFITFLTYLINWQESEFRKMRKIKKI